MKKEQVLIGLGVATAIVTAFNGHVQADEVTNKQSNKTTVSQSETKKDVEVSESDVKNAEAKLNKAIDEEKNVQKVVDKIQQEHASTVTNKNKADDALKQAQEFAKQATPEKIKNAEKNLAAKQVTVKKAEENLAGAKQGEKQAQTSVENQQTVVNKAKTQVDQRAADVKKAQDKVRVAENSFDWNTLRELQQATEKLDAKVKANQDKVNSLTNSVSKAEQERKALVERGNKTRSNLEKNVKSAGSEFLTEKVEHQLKEDKVSDDNSMSTTLSPEYSSWIGKDGKRYYVVSNENVDFNGEKTETIIVNSKDDVDKPHVVDYKKVSRYIREYLVELRRINGIDIPVPEVTDKALKWAKARTDEMARNNELSHDTVLKTSEFELKGETENASQGSLQEKSTLDEKQIAYEELLSYFHDYNNASSYGTDNPNEVNRYNYGHRIPLLAASGTGLAMTQTNGYGILTFVSDNNRDVYNTLPSVVSPSERSSYTYNGETYYSNPYSSHFLARAENKDGDKNRSEFYFNGKRVKFLPKTTFRYVWNEITHPKNPAYTKAKEALDNFNRKQRNEETVANEKLSSLNNNLTIAKTTLDKDKKELDKSKKRLVDLTKQNEAKLNVLKSAQAELSKQQTLLSAAKTEFLKQESQLNRLKAIKNNKSHASKNAEQSLANAKKDLTKAQQDVINLKNAPRKLDDAKKQLIRAKQKVEESKKALDNANVKLKLANAKKEAAKKEYTKVSEAYKQYLLLKQKAASKGSWIQSSGRWWYRHNNGSYTTNGWELIDSTWYYFDSSGWMQTGWVKTGGSWYYLNSSGGMKTGWVKTGGLWYYLNSSGAMQTGWFSVSGKWYYAYGSGALAVNTTTPDGYHVNYNGEWIK
ncbi:hypothetical protein [Streptococcus oralis]|uniref:hypothetical protein n=1 Tax=Streptococcus oralis TaxID=1303 RepID=UPI000B06759A